LQKQKEDLRIAKGNKYNMENLELLTLITTIVTIIVAVVVPVFVINKNNNFQRKERIIQNKPNLLFEHSDDIIFIFSGNKNEMIDNIFFLKSKSLEDYSKENIVAGIFNSKYSVTKIDGQETNYL